MPERHIPSARAAVCHHAVRRTRRIPGSNCRMLARIVNRLAPKRKTISPLCRKLSPTTHSQGRLTRGADMATTLFVNLPVENLARSHEFFTKLGFEFFAMTDGIASVIISEHTQVMLMTKPTFASYVRTGVVDANDRTEVILALGLETPTQVDELVEKALASGAAPIGETRKVDGRYQRAFADLDGHHWEALCLVQG
jgi:uncharacterized protein